ncbi:hypothetical protein NQ314_011540 [Rhamnusium bicolor]|uniref:DDE-1 domain-containing protein n=1 Tax=Rhamnusium bicolor TaxID=1586634 RepID=A0AAV8XII8_9CUCU|nr:hypothetical protein NQ314_011540 [Rhamnusium bicolor]
MKSDVFYQYVANGLNPWIQSQNNIQKPVLFLVDGHRSHMSVELSKFCDDNDIILYALPPNSTHIMQPADVGLFKPLKEYWRQAVRNCQNDHEGKSVTKIEFATVFEEALNNQNISNHIRNAFRRCGLFPYNPDAVDYTKCVQNTLEQIQPIENMEQEASNSDDFKTTYKVLNNLRSNILERVDEVDWLVKELKTYEEKILSNKRELEENEILNEPSGFVEYDINEDGYLSLVKEKEPKINILRVDIIPPENHPQPIILAADDRGVIKLDIKNKNKEHKSSDIISSENDLQANLGIPAIDENNKIQSEKENNNSKEPKTSDIIYPEFDLQNTGDELSISALEKKHITLEAEKSIYFKFSDQNNSGDTNISEDPNIKIKDKNQTDQIMILKELKTNNLNTTEDQPSASRSGCKPKVNLFDSHLKLPKLLEKTKRDKSGPSTSAILAEAWISYYIQKENIKLEK